MRRPLPNKPLQLRAALSGGTSPVVAGRVRAGALLVLADQAGA